MKEPPQRPLQCGSAAAAPIEFEFIRKKWEQGDLNGLHFWKGGSEFMFSQFTQLHSRVHFLSSVSAEIVQFLQIRLKIFKRYSN